MIQKFLSKNGSLRLCVCLNTCVVTIKTVSWDTATTLPFSIITLDSGRRKSAFLWSPTSLLK